MAITHLVSCLRNNVGLCETIEAKVINETVMYLCYHMDGMERICRNL